MTRITFLTALFVLIVSVYNGALAEDSKLPLAAGMYTVKVTTTSNASPNSASKVVEMCIDKEVLDPEDYLPKTANCSLENIKKEGTNVGFDIDCKGDENTGVPPMKGKGMCGSYESGFDCSFDMTGKIQGKELSLNSLREGKRIGDCP